MRIKTLLTISLVTLAVTRAPGAAAQAPQFWNALPAGPARATIDLATPAGAGAVNGQWRYSDTRIIEVDFRAAGPEGQPSGGPVKTYDYAPHAGGADFDDSKWEAIAADSLSKRRGNGRISFAWYRIRITVPQRVGDYDPTGSTIVFETSLDDAAEIWVDGELPRALGQIGGSVASGWNAPNRLVIARNARPGQQIQLAIFGINGPLSNPPTNYIWMRHARLEFFDGPRGPLAFPVSEVNVEVIRKDPAIESIVGANPKLWKLAAGFQFTEGPVWVAAQNALLFSDPNANTIYKYTPKMQALEVFRTPSGYSGADIGEYRQPGSNGLTLDAQGNLVINQHGNRRIVRLEPDGRETVLADRFEAKRLNSPNDLVYRSDGALFFTDPFFGLPKFGDDPRRELPFTGVFALINGKVKLLTREFTGPNGIAFTPDEKQIYIGNWDDKRKMVVRFDVAADGTLSNEKLFADLTSEPGEDAIDGIKVDQAGNVFISGPGGLWVYSDEGKQLGLIAAPQHVRNMAWGDDDGKTLYLCARGGLYRMRLNFPGAGPRFARAAR